MSKKDVEDVINDTLAAFIVPDSILQKQDSSTMKSVCRECSESLTCKYTGVQLLLTFFRYTMYQKSDFELIGITPVSNQQLIKTEAGIKVGMKEEEFIEICKKNNYPYNFMDIDDKQKGYFFSDNVSKEPSKMLMIRVSNGVINSLDVINMIGD
jgi:hypothetical protein